MSTLDVVEKAGSLDVCGLLSELPKYWFNLYKTTKDKKEAEVVILLSTAVTLAANFKYHSFKVGAPEKPEEICTAIESILSNLNIKDIKVIVKEDMLNAFLDKFKEKEIIGIDTVNGDGCAADIDNFYKEFDNNLRKILKDKIYNNDFLYKTLITELEIACSNSIDDVKDGLEEIKSLLQDISNKLQQEIAKDETNDVKSQKVIVISIGDFNESDYDKILDLRKYFDHRMIKCSDDWNLIKEEISDFAKKLKKEAKLEYPYTLYLSTHMSISYYLGACLNGKASSYSINMVQKTQGKPIDWSIDSSKEKSDFKDMLFNDEASHIHIINEENNDISVCISTMDNSIYNDVYEFINANNIPVKKIIDFNLGDRGGNRSVNGGTHGWFLANQVRNELMKRTIKERKGNLHIFMATPISIPFFLGQLSFAFKNVILYEHTTKADEKEIYAKSIFIEDVDEIG